MRSTLTAIVLSVGLAGFGLTAQAAPVPAAGLLGASVPSDIVPAQYGYGYRGDRRRAIRREVRRERREMRRDRSDRRAVRRVIRGLTR